MTATTSPTTATTAPTTAPRRINRFQTWAWYYMRLSGLLLIPLALGHLAIMHLVYGVHEMSYEWVIETRLTFIGWRLYDIFLLWFAGLHGLNGMRHVINDYSRGKWNRVFLGIVALLMVIGLVAGSVALIATPMEVPAPTP